MTRTIATIASLLLALGPMLGGWSCTCGSPAADESQALASPSSETETSANHECCSDEKTPDRNDSDGCCDDGSCDADLARRLGDVASAALLSDELPDANELATDGATTTAVAPWVRDALRRSAHDASEVTPETDSRRTSSSPRRHLTLQVLRL